MGLHLTTTWTHSLGVWLPPVPGLLVLALISKYPETFFCVVTQAAPPQKSRVAVATENK